MSRKRLLVAGGAMVVAIVALAAFAASDSPDGLESVAAEQGFADEADEHALEDSPVADYEIEGLGGGVSTLAAGTAGVAVTFVLGFAWFRFVGRRKHGTKS